MRTVRISDVTLKSKGLPELSFREKMEFVRLLSRLGVDVIEVPEISGSRAETLSLKSIAETVDGSVLAVPVAWDPEKIRETASICKAAAKLRLQIECPASSVQMEYLKHMKGDRLIGSVTEAVRVCRELTDDVELVALDATRAEMPFLSRLITEAAEAGAPLVTISDTAGTMLPAEYATFLKELIEAAPVLSGNVSFAVHVSDALSLSEVCLLAGIECGAAEVKTAIYGTENGSLEKLVSILHAKEEAVGASVRTETVMLQRTADQAAKLFTETTKSLVSRTAEGAQEERIFTKADDLEAFRSEVKRLGYDLFEEDLNRVYTHFLRIAGKKDSVSSKEIDALVASIANEVPPTYVLEDFIINSGNTITATSHMRLRKKGELLEAVAMGDGPVDASFRAIEQIVGTHFELDDFQIRSVTEGHSAMGETVVKLRANGKLYSGHGLSTDIIGSSIRAYLSPLNKIVYEEENL